MKTGGWIRGGPVLVTGGLIVGLALVGMVGCRRDDPEAIPKGYYRVSVASDISTEDLRSVVLTIQSSEPTKLTRTTGSGSGTGYMHQPRGWGRRPWEASMYVSATRVGRGRPMVTVASGHSSGRGSAVGSGGGVPLAPGTRLADFIRLATPEGGFPLDVPLGTVVTVAQMNGKPVTVKVDARKGR